MKRILIPLLLAAILCAGRPADVLDRSGANRRAIEKYLIITEAENPARSHALLATVADSDLQRADLYHLLDSYYCTPIQLKDTPLYSEALRVRVADEPLSMYKLALSKTLSDSLERAYTADPRRLAQWVMDSIAVCDTLPHTLPAPAETWNRRAAATNHERMIVLTAMLRTLGIPAVLTASDTCLFSPDGNTWQVM